MYLVGGEKMSAKKEAPRKAVRDAGTGRFVKKEEATKRPKTTVTETMRPTKKK